jgi:hypothetical protein
MLKHVNCYLQESSINGFWYLSAERTQKSEKLLWVLALVVSFVCCGFLIFEIGLKYQEDALVTYSMDSGIAVIDVSSSIVLMSFTFNLRP